MPLTRRQFDLAIDEEGEEWMRQVYELLAEHRDLAYSSKELREAVLGESSGTAKWERFDHAVSVLAEIGAVEKRWVADTGYYAFLQEFDTDAWQPRHGL